MAGIIDKLKTLADEEQAKIAKSKKEAEASVTPNLLSGPAKIATGLVGAVPTAVGRTIEQIPAGIGKLIGAVPKNSADYSTNPALDLAGQGVTETATGLRDVGKVLRSGAMNLFGLKEAPPASAAGVGPSVAAPAGVGVPKPTIAPPEPTASGGYDMDTYNKIKAIGDNAVRNDAVGVGEPATESPYYNKIPDGKGGYALIPKESAGVGPTETPIEGPKKITGGEVNDLVNQLMNNPAFQGTQDMGGGVIKRGVSQKMRGEILSHVMDIKKAELGLQGQTIASRIASADRQMAARLGLQGHQIQAETARLAHRESVEARDDLVRERLDIMRQDMENRKAAGEDTRALNKSINEERIFQKDLTTFGTDKTTGVYDADRGLFEMGFAGIHTGRPEVAKAFGEFNAQVASLEKQYNAKLRPDQLAKLKKNYMLLKGWAE